MRTGADTFRNVKKSISSFRKEANHCGKKNPAREHRKNLFKKNGGNQATDN